ncbi:TPR repeat-containing protein [Escherichia coli]|jgi:hypothetical protein|nr:TPR repeat-containing protein [Escherichia coli]
MTSLVVPGLDTLRQWLDDLGMSFFECDNCQALHLPHMQNFDGVFDAKIDLIDNTILFLPWRKSDLQPYCRWRRIYLPSMPVR